MSVWRNIFCVITSPHYGWELINDSNIPVEKVMRSAYVPLLFILAFSCFVPMVYDKTYPFSRALMTGIVMFWTYILSYYSIVFILGTIYPDMIKTQGATARMNDFTLYNLIFLVLLMILRNLLPSDFTPVLFLLLYLPWMSYRGTEHLFVEKEKVSKFVVISSVLLLGVPLAISALLNLFVI